MNKTKEDLTIFHGTHIWKSGLEYYNEKMFMHGRPYFQITEIEDVYYLWELDLSDPDPSEYRVMKTGNDFAPLHAEGMEFAEKLGQKYDEMDLYYVRGKELIKKLTGKN